MKNNWQKNFDEILDNDELMDKYFEKLSIKKEIKEKRYQKFEKWLESNNFDLLMDKIVDEHNDDYIDKCYKNGFEPHPNNKLSFIFDYIFENLEYIEDHTIESYDFSTSMRFFKNYHFVNIYGQGTFSRIYKNKELILTL